ncbi:MAG: hypothetical protein AAF618_00805 [Pseudomonadota bacterium]
MKKGKLQITDHALLRHLERVEGLDVEGAKRGLARTLDALVPEEMADGLSGIGYRGHVYEVRGDKVVTVTPRHEAKRGQVKGRR